MAVFPKLHAVLHGREVWVGEEALASVMDGYIYSISTHAIVRSSLKRLFLNISDEELQNVEGKVFDETLLKRMAAGKVKSIRFEAEKVILTTRDEEEPYYYAGSLPENMAQLSTYSKIQKKSIHTGEPLKEQTFRHPAKNVLTSLFDDFKIKMYAEASLNIRDIADVYSAFSNSLSRYSSSNAVTIQYGDSDTNVQPTHLIRVEPADFDKNEKEEALIVPVMVNTYGGEEELINSLF